MSVVAGNKVPLYQQVAQTLKQRVRTGLYRTSDPLPSVRSLSEEFGVSLTVVQRAVRHLEEKGVVKTQPGKAMLVAEHEACEMAAIMFGFIHPYGTSMTFSRDVLGFVDQAFEDRSNFAIVRTSRDDPIREREVAEHLIANGVKGLIVWPASNNPNGEYFTSLSKTVPVVLIDRLLAKANLPAVIVDCYAGGIDICNHLLNNMKKKRLLVLMDDLRITTYEDTIRGIRYAASAMGRMGDITIVQLPLTKFIQGINNCDFSEVPAYAEYVERLLSEGNYDALFCTQDEFIDYAMVETGVTDKFPSVQLGIMVGKGVNTRSAKYNRLGVLSWTHDMGNMVSVAADMVQQWLLSRRMPKDIVKLKLQLSERRSTGSGDNL